MSAGRPYSPRMLAERWECSEAHIRQMVAKGELTAFRLGGKLIRISAEEVEKVEGGCQSSDSDDTRACSVSSTTKEAGDIAARWARTISTAPRQGLPNINANTPSTQEGRGH